jgi:hypothetical protein
LRVVIRISISLAPSYPEPMRRRSTRALVLVTLIGLAGHGVVACGGEPATTIPPGATRVSVMVAGPAVRLAPPTVPAGEVFLLFEPDPETEHVPVAFVHGGGPLDDTPDPLSDDQLAILRRGEQGPGLSLEFGLPPVHQVTLAPGRYAFVAAGDDGLAPNFPDTMAILEVTP